MSHRFALRWCAEDMPWLDHAELIRDALWNRCVIAFWLCRGDPEPAFRLFGVPGAVRVYSSAGTCIGVFSDLDAALGHGWAYGWWWGVPEGSRGTIGQRVTAMGE